MIDGELPIAAGGDRQLSTQSPHSFCVTQSLVQRTVSSHRNKQGRNRGLVFFRVLLVRMAVLGALGGSAFLTAAACRHQAKETDQEHRTDQRCWGFHWKTLQKMGEINGLRSG